MPFTFYQGSECGPLDAAFIFNWIKGTFPKLIHLGQTIAIYADNPDILNLNWYHRQEQQQ